jgi:hypothetical protein
MPSPEASSGHRNSRSRARRIEWKLEERDGKWLIVETTYLQK